MCIKSTPRTRRDYLAFIRCIYLRKVARSYRALNCALKTYIKDRNFIDAFALGIRLSGKIFVDILEVGDGNILLKLFIEYDIVIDQLNLPCEILKRSCTALSVCLRVGSVVFCALLYHDVIKVLLSKFLSLFVF